jgi:hypothetical protein
MSGRKSAKPVRRLESISGLAGRDLRDKLVELPLDDQVRLFLRSNWRDRIKIVRFSSLADELVASIPDEEILLAFRGAGEDEGLQLIAHAADEQLRFVLDIDLWDEHAVDEEQVLKWLGYLVSLGERSIMSFVRGCDLELVVVFLSKLICLIPFEEAVEMGDELTSIMPDEAFVVQPRIVEEIPSIRLFLSVVRAEDRDLYGQLRYAVYRSIETEAEEEAYRWRNSRLEEKGILEYREAAGIYDPLPESRIRELTNAGGRPYYARAGEIQVPAFYPLELSSSRPLYYELLTSLEEGDLKQRITGDVSYVANRLLVADGRAVGDVDATGAALGRLFSLANVGLLLMADRTGRTPGEIMKAVSITDLFKIGLGAVMGLKREAQEIGRKCRPAGGTAEPAPLEEYHSAVLNGLLRRLPQYYVPGADDGEDYRDFRTPEEIVDTKKVLDQISVLWKACFGKSGAGDSGPAMPAGKTNFGNVLMTGFARFVLSGEATAVPLKKRELDRFLDTAFVDAGEAGRALDAAAGEEYLAWLKGKTGLEAHEWAILEAYVMERFEALEEEISGALSAKDVDSLLTRGILLAW